MKTKHGEFDIRPITFGERREIHKLEMKVYWEDKIEREAYFELLDFVMHKAFEDPEAALKDLDDAQIDELLNEIYFEYKNISKKSYKVRIATWCNFFGWGNSHYPVKFKSYEAQSPTLGKVITFNEQEIWDEVERVTLEDKKQKFTVGQNLYYNLNFSAILNSFRRKGGILYRRLFHVYKI